MGVHGFKKVGCGAFMWREAKREEKMHKWLRKAILVMHDHGEKMQEVGVNSHGGLEGTMVRKREETRGERSRMNMYKQEKEKK